MTCSTLLIISSSYCIDGRVSIFSYSYFIFFKGKVYILHSNCHLIDNILSNFKLGQCPSQSTINCHCYSNDKNTLNKNKINFFFFKKRNQKLKKAKK
jgi:hypothetical protein